MTNPTAVKLQQPPELRAYRDPATHFLRGECLYCRRRHYHGQDIEHRVAHCYGTGSPFQGAPAHAVVGVGAHTMHDSGSVCEMHLWSISCIPT